MQTDHSPPRPWLPRVTYHMLGVAALGASVRCPAMAVTVTCDGQGAAARSRATRGSWLGREQLHSGRPCAIWPWPPRVARRESVVAARGRGAGYLW